MCVARFTAVITIYPDYSSPECCFPSRSGACEYAIAGINASPPYDKASLYARRPWADVQVRNIGGFTPLYIMGSIREFRAGERLWQE